MDSSTAAASSDFKSSSVIEIAGRAIGPGYPPYIIAELSACHNGQLKNALKLIELAKLAGADAVKIQTYRPDTITMYSKREEFKINGGLWDGQYLYQLYESAYTPWEWHLDLFDKAAKVGITLFSSPFDSTAVDLLESLNTPAYKIASFELVDLPLIARVAQTGKPILMSNGMASLHEIDEAIECARSNGASEIALLHCVSGYPAPSKDYNLMTIPDLAAHTGLPIGLSDHSIGNITSICAVSLGACIIEKHFTLDRNAGGPDDSFAIEPEELSDLCKEARSANDAIGSVHYGPVESESSNLLFRRSLFVTRDIKAGEKLTNENVRSIRPGNGLPPKHLPEVLGRRAARELSAGTPLEWDALSPIS